MLKKIAAAGAIMVAASVGMAGESSAATLSDASDRAYLWSLAKGAWLGLDYDSQQSICDLYDLSHSLGISQMTDTIASATDYEYTYYDARATAKRLMRWGC